MWYNIVCIIANQKYNMSKTYPLSVTKVENNTADTITIEFGIPTHLKSEFDYEPGQYLTVEVDLDGKRHRRAYSMCTSPLTDLSPAVTVKRLEGGLISNYLNDNVKVGDKLKILPPYGNFVPSLNDENQKHYVLFGAGSGITPLMSILKSILTFETKSKLSFLYGNRNEDSIIFREELNALAEKYPDRFNLVHTLSQASESWNGNVGRIAAENAKDFVWKYADDDWNKSYFICGPTGMIKTVEQTLLDMGISAEFINREYFVMEEKETPEEIVAAVNESGPQKVKVILDNQEFEVEVSPNETILDAALDNNIDAPFSCMAAACATCRAKVVSGNVVMDDREMLSDEEIEEGYVLTCQAHPTTADVVINYDE